MEQLVEDNNSLHRDGSQNGANDPSSAMAPEAPVKTKKSKHKDDKEKKKKKRDKSEKGERKLKVKDLEVNN